MRLRVTERVFIPSVDERYRLEPGKDYRMSPLALSRMLRSLDRRSMGRDSYYRVLAMMLIDKPGELEIGKLYIIRGAGVMKLVTLHQPEPNQTTCNFISAGAGLNSWVGAEEVLREADPEYLELYIENNRRAGFHAQADGVEQWIKEQNESAGRCPDAEL